MADKKLENKIDLDVSVSEQIADMQLMFLRDAALNRVLNFDEIKALEILSKVKNNEEEKRQPKDEDPKKTRSKELQKLAQAMPILVDAPKEEMENDKEKTTISKS